MKEVNRAQQPNLQQQIGNYWLLWFKAYNRYSILEPRLNEALNLFFVSKDEDEFRYQIRQKTGNALLEPKLLYHELVDFLSMANEMPVSKISLASASAFQPDYCAHTREYKVNGIAFRVHYQDEATLNLVHHALASHSGDTASHLQAEFWIYNKSGCLHLFQDGHLVQAVDERQYHYIQGKFLMRVISLVHGLSESDWIGTLHASAVVKNGTAILLAGQSGKGKSTLTALLASGGFELLADDISPLATSLEVFHNPSAISIKKGAFQVVSQHFETFASCPEIFVNATKGTVKYLPLPRPERLHYPCKALVLVDYQAGAASSLSPVEPAEVIQYLIPDSWISPDPLHARAFLDWLSGLSFFRMTYSNSEHAIQAISTLTAQQ